MIGPPGDLTCVTLLVTLQHTFSLFWVSLAREKTEGPSTELSFLGIVINSMTMQCRLPLEKVAGFKGDHCGVLDCKKIQLHALQHNAVMHNGVGVL